MKNKFSLSNYKLGSCNMGELVPVGLTEVLPGDMFQHATSMFLRTSPLLSPVMHPVNVRIHHWFVPHRLVWNDWEQFITGGSDPDTRPTFPTITPNTGSGYAVGSLADYLGVPTGVDDLPHSALPFRGYALIFNEYYRDQDLTTALTIDKTDGADTTTNVTLQNVCWEKDYFTSARPTPQKGAEVVLPLGDTAPVLGIGSMNQTFTAGPVTAYESDATSSSYAEYKEFGGALEGNDHRFYVERDPNNPGYPNIHADLTAATAASVNDVRRAFALQRFLENRSRYGSRYPEYLKFLGVRSSDARLQRPEYLGGGKQTIQFSEVVQTAVNTSGTPATGLGALAGHGASAMRSNRYRRFFEEHGYVFTMLSVLPKTIYANGLPRTWSRTTREDFWQKELEHIGQQEVLNKEAYWADSGPNDVFGYQDRYDEYRRQESTISGDFRSSNLNYWHLARIFASDVTLNNSFVTSNPATRIFQSTSVDTLQFMANHSIQAKRLIAKRGSSFML